MATQFPKNFSCFPDSVPLVCHTHCLEWFCLVSRIPHYESVTILSSLMLYFLHKNFTISTGYNTLLLLTHTNLNFWLIYYQPRYNYFCG